ncbi:MAG: metal ABC transporter substrate-binding protein [Clostridiales bacterium]|nr:metal ABC transporter substrate-binding protein [Clostridiales bacterium]
MKKVILSIISVVCFATLAGCSATENSAGVSDEGKLSVISTVFTPYDFSRSITGELADVSMLLPPAAESHSFEPTPQDIIKVQNSDVFVYVGGESDEWVNTILESLDTSKMTVITLMDCVEVVEEEIVEGMEEEEEEEEGIAYDEHVWTSPKNAKLIVQKISDALVSADPKNAAAYEKNTDDYLSRLTELDASFQAVVDGAKRKTIVMGDRFPFRYLADAYGLDYFAAFPGCSTETECSAATIAFLIDKINAEQIPVVFHIELSNENIAKSISEATGAENLLLHACHNITKADFDNGKTYIDLMKGNVETLKAALG